MLQVSCWPDLRLGRKKSLCALLLEGRGCGSMMLHLSDSANCCDRSCSGLRVRELGRPAWIILTAPPTLDLPLAGLLRFSISAFWPLLASSRWSRLDQCSGAGAEIFTLGPAPSHQERFRPLKRGWTWFFFTGCTVVMQVAASVLLLVGAGLLTRTLWHASQVHLGFDPNTPSLITDLIRQGYDKNAAVNLLGPCWTLCRRSRRGVSRFGNPRWVGYVDLSKDRRA